MIHWRLVFLVSISAVLVACSTSSGGGGGSIASSRLSEEGIVFGSIGSQRVRPFAHASFGIRPLGSGGANVIADEKLPHRHRVAPGFGRVLISGGSQFSTDTDEANLFSFALPPGRYEIYTFSFRWENFNGNRQGYFSVPFEIKRGEAVYLGRYIARIIPDGRILAKGAVDKVGSANYAIRDITPAAYFAVRNEIAADSDVLRRTLGVGKDVPITDARPSVCEWNLFRC